MSETPAIDGNALCQEYFGAVQDLMQRVLTEEAKALDEAADILADEIAADRLIHVFGPGGHSNLATQEVFFRAGGLMHIDAILDEGTMLANGALRSMAIERTPGYGRVVIANRGLGAPDVLVLVNAYGINAALIDSALE
ncbi:MAG: SIS domain-containing protein, partial [Pseudomonadota bacterium]